MSIKQLRERWTADQIASVETQFVTASRTPKGITFESPYGLTDAGLLDYRGITLDEAVKYTRMDRVDFTGAKFRAAALVDSTFERCLFDRFELRGAFVSKSFTQCSFVGAKLQQARLGEVFTDCDFSKANLSGTVMRNARLERCNFTGARLGSIQWIGCEFDACVFDDLVTLSGSYAHSIFTTQAPQRTERCIDDGVRYVDVD